MDASRVAELEALLSEALRTVRFRRGHSEQMSQGQYRQLLQRCRQVYDPIARRHVASFEAEIGDPSIQAQISDFVGHELSDYIRDGLIHAATIAISGGSVSGSPVEHVAHNLLRYAVLDGPSTAAAAFAACAENVSCSFYQYWLLPSIAVEEPVDVIDDITILPLPSAVEDLPPHLPHVDVGPPAQDDFVSARHLVGRSVLRAKYYVTPIFHKPAEHYTFDSGPEEHFTIRRSGALAEVSLDTLCQSLSVAARRSVRVGMTWVSLADYEVFDLGSFWGIGASGWSFSGAPSSFEDPVLIGRPQLETVEALYRAISGLPEETWDRLRIPIDRWMKSMEQDNPVDQLIDIGIALESLYVPSSQSGVSLRFALHASWHLGRSPEERRQLRKEFTEIYAARSDVVHTGRLRGSRAKTSFDVSEFVRRAQHLCWRGITAVIDAGQTPDWDALIMGDEVD